MTPEEIKSKLGKNKNLAELQAKLAKVNNCSGKVKEFYQNQVQLKKFSSIEFNLQVPVRYESWLYALVESLLVEFFFYFQSTEESLQITSQEATDGGETAGL